MKKKLDNILESIIKEHQLNHNQGHGEDLVDVLLHVQQRGTFEIPITN